jgi:D-alanine-D-alanine ligase
VRTAEDIRTTAWRIPEVRDLEVVVLYSLALGLERGRAEDRIADQETASVAMGIAAALEGQVRATHLVPVWDDLPVVVGQFDPRRHVIFNLVESLGGRAFTEPEPPRIFESMGFIYTGTDYKSITRSANKLTTKKLLESAGLPTPRCQVFRQPEVRRVGIRLPALVKPIAEGGSFGVSQDSLATDERQLAERVRRCLEIYRQTALAEEYIIGREINVALWGNHNPTVLPISEIVFEWTDDPLRQFVTFESKWVCDSVEFTGTPGICPAPLTSAERTKIEEVAIEAYQALGFRGFARVDMRLRDGIPYVLEVNANPDLAPDAGFFRSASVAGFSYSAMVQHILQLALEAHYA